MNEFQIKDLYTDRNLFSAWHLAGQDADLSVPSCRDGHQPFAGQPFRDRFVFSGLPLVFTELSDHLDTCKEEQEPHRHEKTVSFSDPLFYGLDHPVSNDRQELPGPARSGCTGSVRPYPVQPQ